MKNFSRLSGHAPFSCDFTCGFAQSHAAAVTASSHPFFLVQGRRPSLKECQRKVAKDCPVVAKTGQCPIEKGMGSLMGLRGMRPEGMGPMTGHDMR